MEALCSVLEPGTHIPPHQGTANHRLTVHLPLVVPCRSTLTVNGQPRPVASGNAMLFDDTFEHVARNDSDAVCIVLIFQVWHPDLSAAERFAIDESYAAYLHWVNDRALLDAIQTG